MGSPLVFAIMSTFMRGEVPTSPSMFFQVDFVTFPFDGLGDLFSAIGLTAPTTPIGLGPPGGHHTNSNTGSLHIEQRQRQQAKHNFICNGGALECSIGFLTELLMVMIDIPALP